MVHHGSALKEIVERSPYTVDDLAKMLNINRRSIYFWFGKDFLKKSIIDRVGNAIGVDIYATRPTVFGSDQVVFTKKPIDNQPPGISDHWQKRYMDQIQKNQKLSESNLNLMEQNYALKDKVRELEAQIEKSAKK